MRIAFFTNCYKPLINGVVSSIVSLKESLEKKGHETFIFAPRMEAYQDEESNIFRYHSINLTHKVKYPVAIPLSLRAGQVINKFKPDIIHLHHPFVLSLPAIMYAAKLKIPKVLTIHTQYERYAYYVSPIPHIITNEAIRRIIFNLSDKVDIITTPSQSMKDLILNYKIKKEIIVIPNAIDISIFQKINRQEVKLLKKELLINPDDVVIIYVGRVSLEKNIDKIIKALALIRNKKIDNFVFIVVGEGTSVKQLSSLADSLKMREKVKFVGAIAREMVRYYYQIGDIFAFSSTSETFGMVIIEALASGLPVLAVKAPGAIDIIQDGFDGILVEDDVLQFAEKLENLIQNKDLRKKLSLNGLKTVQRYSIEAVSDQVLELYGRLLSGKSKTSDHISSHT
ncbi:MAG: glycosyltransferase [Atribacterota bacterium]